MKKVLEKGERLVALKESRYQIDEQEDVAQ